MLIQIKRMIKDKSINSRPFCKNYWKGSYHIQVQKTVICIFHIPVFSWEKVLKYSGVKTFFN